MPIKLLFIFLMIVVPYSAYDVNLCIFENLSSIKHTL